MRVDAHQHFWQWSKGWFSRPEAVLSVDYLPENLAPILKAQGVDKTITHTQIAPGALTSQSVSVLVDKTVPATALPAIKAAVSNAVGLNTKRGDTLSLGQLSFAKPTTTAPAAASSTSSMMGYAKYGAVGLGSLIFLIFSGRMLRRRERENFAGQATWIRELESPRTLASRIL